MRRLAPDNAALVRAAVAMMAEPGLNAHAAAEKPGLSRTRRAFLDTLPAVRLVVASQAVAERWDESSALAGFSVRGLAGHLVRGAVTVETYLDRSEPTGKEPISCAAYFAPLTSDIASPLNMAVRQRGEQRAAAGHDHLVAELDRTIARLNDRLAHEADDRLLSVIGDAVMRLDEYLVTRIVELTVHADDLAVSVGLPPPTLPATALDIAIAALMDIARSRHGDQAVLRALTRRERDAPNALRVL